MNRQHLARCRPGGPVDRNVRQRRSQHRRTDQPTHWPRVLEASSCNTDKLVDAAAAEEERKRAISESLAQLRAGNNIVISATIGPDDPIIEKTRQRVRELGIDQSETGKLIGRQQGLILRALLEETGLSRVCVAGGDTCSYTLRQLDIHSLELLMPIAPAAPLCRTSSDNDRFDGLQVASKGGQIGAPNYFIQVLEGKK